MNSQELFYACIDMPEARLLNLIDFEFKEVLKIELEIVDDWIKNKKCRCAEHPDIQSKKFSLSCNHLNKELDKKIGNMNERIGVKCGALNLRSLSHSNRFKQNQGGGE